VCMLIRGYCFLCIGCVVGNVASRCVCLSDIRPVASVTFDFIDAAFVIVWSGVVSLSIREVFYCDGASEWIGNFAYLWAVICEG
jgi:hypothetical protein